MTDDHDPSNPNDPHDDHDGLTDPFPVASGESPFPPLEESFPPQPAPVTEPEVAPDAGLAPADPDSDWIEGADAHDLPTLEHRLSALHRFAFPPAPPLDDEGVAARDRRWASRTILLTTLFLLVFNIASIQNWSHQQAPGWLTSTVQQLADVWAGQVAQLGADQPRAAVREAYETARDQRFIGQAPASQAALDPAAN